MRPAARSAAFPFQEARTLPHGLAAGRHGEGHPLSDLRQGQYQRRLSTGLTACRLLAVQLCSDGSPRRDQGECSSGRRVEVHAATGLPVVIRDAAYPSSHLRWQPRPRDEAVCSAAVSGRVVREKRSRRGLAMPETTEELSFVSFDGRPLSPSQADLVAAPWGWQIELYDLPAASCSTAAAGG